MAIATRSDAPFGKSKSALSSLVKDRTPENNCTCLSKPEIKLVRSGIQGRPIRTTKAVYIGVFASPEGVKEKET
jgi:hypothetical protein